MKWLKLDNFEKPLTLYISKILNDKGSLSRKLTKKVKKITQIQKKIILDFGKEKLILNSRLAPSKLAKLPRSLQRFSQYHASIQIDDGSLRLGTELLDLEDGWLDDVKMKFKAPLYAPIVTDQGLYILTSDKPSKIFFLHHEGGKPRAVKKTLEQEFFSLLMKRLKIINHTKKSQIKLPPIKDGYLFLEKVKMKDLNQLADTLQEKGIDQVVSLRLDSCGLLSTAGVERFNSLKALFLQNNSIADLTGLEHMSQLEILNLDNNCLNTTSGFGSSLKKLRKLTLSSNNLKDIEDISQCAELESLMIHGNPLTSLPTALYELQKLNLFVYPPGCKMSNQVKVFLQHKKLLR